MGRSPVGVQHLRRRGVHRVDNDASVAPASLKQVLVLVTLSGVKGLVEEGPGQLPLSVDLQCPSGSHPDVLPPKVAVFLVVIIQPDDNAAGFSQSC